MIVHVIITCYRDSYVIVYTNTVNTGVLGLKARTNKYKMISRKWYQGIF